MHTFDFKPGKLFTTTNVGTTLKEIPGLVINKNAGTDGPPRFIKMDFPSILQFWNLRPSGLWGYKSTKPKVLMFVRRHYKKEYIQDIVNEFLCKNKIIYVTFAREYGIRFIEPVR